MKKKITLLSTFLLSAVLLMFTLSTFTDYVRDNDNLKIELRSNISYVVDGDTVNTVSVKNNYNFKLPTIPEKVGYIIAGWESSLTDSSRTGEHSVGKQLQAIEDEVWTAKYVSLYTYTHAGTNQVSVTGFNPDVLAYLQTYPANIEFPAVVDWNDGRLVTGVSSSAFAGSSVQSVKFGENMTSVGNESFKGSQLTEVDLSSLDSIGAEAFADNKLTHVDLPSTVATLGRSAFSDNLIKTINIANGVSTISNSAFARNVIEELVLPSSVTTIGDYAFLGNRLTEITLSDTLNSIGIQAFHGNVGGEVYANVKSGDLGDRWAPTFRGYKFEASWKHGQGLVKVEFKDALGVTYYEAWQQPGVAPTPPADPTRTGYTFTGWDPGVGSVVTVDTVFTPTWKINQYTLTFNSNGGSTVASKTQDYGSSVTAPANPTRTGYTFAGWSPAVPSTMPAANSTHTAQWTINTYAVTFNANGGTGAPASQTKTYGTNLTLSSTKPTRTGYTFTGWNTNSAGTGTSYAPGASYTANSAVTLYAQWTINTYGVAFNANGGTGAPASQTKTYGTALTLSSTVPTRTGYTFTGWNTNAAGTGTSYAPGASYTANSAVTLYAQWTIKSYTVQFNLNGGTSTKPANQTVNHGSKATVPTNPTRTGYTFTGWSPNINNTITGNTTFTAQWEINTYTVTFNSDGGSAVASQSVNHGSKATVPTSPTKTGHTFAGWSPAIESTTITGNTTFKALWTVNKYTVTFNSDGGSAVASQSVSYGSKATVPANPTKTGYTFAGWSPAIESTTITGNRTFTAQWTPNKYTVTFNSDGGSAVASQSVNYGSKATPPSNPTKTGYTFAGWSPAIGTTITGNTTFTAQWTLNKYTVTFNLNGGTGTAPNQTVNHGSKAVVPANPTRAGYLFTGWTPAITTPITENTTFVAQWELPTYIAYEFDLSLGNGYVNIADSDLQGQEVYVYEGLYEDNKVNIEDGYKNPDYVFTDLTYNTNLRDKLGNTGVYTVIATKMSGTGGSVSNSALIGVPRFDIIELGVTNLSYMFYSATSLTTLDVSNWDVSSVTNMSWMFRGASSLTTLDVSNWDVRKVTNMSYMFSNAQSLTTLDVSNWDVSNVTNMRYMFYNASSLTTLDVSNWDVSNVTNMSYMFYNASSLTTLDVSNWDVSNVTDMRSMFYNASSLTSLDVSSWDVGKVTNMSSMFYNASSLTSLDVSNWDVSNVTDMRNMFRGARSLTTLDVSNWDVSNVTAMSQMFRGASSLTNADASGWDVRHISSKPSGFDTNAPNWPEAQKPCWGMNGCPLPPYIAYEFDLSLGNGYVNIANSDLQDQEVYVYEGLYEDNKVNIEDGFKNPDYVFTDLKYNTNLRIRLGYTGVYTVIATKMSKTGGDVSNRALIGVPHFDVIELGVTNLSYMFYYANKLTSLDVSNWDVSSVTNMDRMFRDARSLTTLDVSNWDVSNVTNMQLMFYNASKLTSLDVSSWDVSKVTDMSSMFYNASSLTSLDVSSWDVSKVTDMNYMFSGASSLTTLDVSNWDVSNVTNMNSMFQGTPLTTLDVSNWDVSRVTAMSQMFRGASSLTTLDVSNWNVSNVTDMDSMFSGASSLTSLDVSNWNVSNVTDMRWMFNSASSLTNADASGWDVRHISSKPSEFDANAPNWPEAQKPVWGTSGKW